MKSKVLSYCKTHYEVLQEKILEWAEHLKYKLKCRKSYSSSLVEIYYIDKKFINEDFVQEFLKLRKKIIKDNRYKMSVVETSSNNKEDVIGEVKLFRKKTFIHKASLVIKSNDAVQKLIYWKFE